MNWPAPVALDSLFLAVASPPEFGADDLVDHGAYRQPVGHVHSRHAGDAAGSRHPGEVPADDREQGAGDRGDGDSSPPAPATPDDRRQGILAPRRHDHRNEPQHWLPGIIGDEGERIEFLILVGRGKGLCLVVAVGPPVGQKERVQVGERSGLELLHENRHRIGGLVRRRHRRPAGAIVDAQRPARERDQADTP